MRDSKASKSVISTLRMRGGSALVNPVPVAKVRNAVVGGTTFPAGLFEDKKDCTTKET